MRFGIVILLLVYFYSCSSTIEQIDKPRIYCGIVDDEYLEYWFYDTAAILYQEYYGISYSKYTIDNDSLFFGGYEYNKLKYMIIRFDEHAMILKNPSDKLGAFFRVDVPYLYDPRDDLLGSGSNIDYMNEAYDRLEFLGDYLSNDSLIRKLFEFQ